MSDYSVTLSTTEPNNYVGLIKLRQGDVASQSIQATITANGQLFKFDRLSVFFNAVLPNGNVIRDRVTEVDYVNSKLNYIVADSFLQEVAQVTAWFSFENDEKTIDSTKNFQYSVIGGWKECIPQGNYIYELSEIQREIEQIIGDKDFSKLLLKIDSIKNEYNYINQVKADKTELNKTNQEIWKLEAITSTLDNKVSTLSSGAPKAVSQASSMTDHTKNYVYTGTESGYTAGNWYYWNGSAWSSGGVYQSQGISNGSIAPSKINKIYNLFVDSNKTPGKYIAGYDTTTLLPTLSDSASQSVSVINLPKRGSIDIFLNTATVGQVMMILDASGKVVGNYPRLNFTGSDISSKKYSWLTPFSNHYTIAIEGLLNQFPTAYQIILSVMNTDSNIFYVNAFGAFSVDDFYWLKNPIVGRNYLYPFFDGVKPIYTWGDNKDKPIPFLLKAIKDIKIFGVDRNNKFALTIIRRNDDANMITDLDIYQVTETSLISSVGRFYQTNYIPKNSIETLDLTSQQTGEIIGYITVNWDELPNGALATSLGWNQAGLDSSVISYGDITPKVHLLPINKIYAVTGHEMNIYYKNLMYGAVNDVEVSGTGTIGQQLTERLRINATTAGTYNYTLNVIDKNVNFPLLASQSISVKVVDAVSANSGISKKVMFIGDSITDRNFYVPEVNNLFNTDSMKVQLVGSRGSGANLHEGRSGWGTSDFVYSQSFNGIDNAFFNPSTGKFDFSYYVSQKGIIPDIIIIMLGTNDTWRSHAGTTSSDNIQFMVNSIKSYSSNIKIGIALNIPPSLSHDASGEQNNFLNPLVNRKKLLQIPEGIFNTFSNQEINGIYIVPVTTNIDTENNFQTVTENLNSRNTTQVQRVIDPIHPALPGYQQIADSMYAFLKNLIF
ncbi:BppU family phage baseplate upper protein [Lactococcus lactis subsp. lactis]|uniref:BppU family phage baseplate upper protein n=1 Tax=Lactococcus lactis TaxID=1358 RepID=UPI001BAFC15F|nr:BppU family phage baseplate upper protein [Lactococcus lactis]MBS3729574.1 BppU family phage baseplate upper protein [Lactococcus lactis subsp. lactis]